MEKERQTILIVDDEGMNVSLLTQVLKDDYRILAAKNGEKALKIAKEGKVDLILLDIIMPEMDGYEICRRLKKNSATAQIPVIFITAVSEVMDEAKTFYLGAVDYIPKPFNPATVKARVDTHINLNNTINELRNALHEIRTLKGLLPICSSCKKIRDDDGYWQQIENYIQNKSEATFTHSICPECAKKLYPDLYASNADK